MVFGERVSDPPMAVLLDAILIQDLPRFRSDSAHQLPERADPIDEPARSPLKNRRGAAFQSYSCFSFPEALDGARVCGPGFDLGALTLNRGFS